MSFVGALNTVGRYLVNMTRGQEPSTGGGTPSDSVPDAILTLSKNVLGQNVTETIAPLIKRVGTVDDSTSSDHGFDTKKKKREHKKEFLHLQQTELTKSPEITTVPSSTTSVEPGIKWPIKSVSLKLKTINYVKLLAKPEDVQGKEGENRCSTPQGRPGRCEDLSVCPELLLNLGDLRDSICFKRLFIPGVCCPIEVHDTNTILTTQRPTILTTR